VAPDLPVSGLLSVLAEHNIGAAVVMSGDGVAGIVSERDVVRAVHRHGADLLDAPVSTIMSEDVVTCVPDDAVDTVQRTMTDRRFRHMPVLVDGRLAGIVSIGDLVKARIGELEEERQHLHSYLAAGS
jgi:CBS domain-containing protein